jgi:RHS repeat-associated protein
MDQFNRISRFFTRDEDETFDVKRDEESGLHLHDMRYFDPLTTTWISEEPIAFAGDEPKVTRYVGGGGRKV